MSDDTESDEVSIRVWYDGDPGWKPDVVPVEMTITGRATEPFVAALARTFGVESNGYWLVEDEGSSPRNGLAWITEESTLGDAARVADGERLCIDIGGRGGDSGIIPTFVEIVNAGLTIVGVYQGGKAFGHAIQKVRNREARALARDWVDTGTDTAPPMRLLQLVYEYARWARGDFDRRFGLDQDAGAKLLRACGYVKVSRDPDVWAEPSPLGP